MIMTIFALVFELSHLLAAERQRTVHTKDLVSLHLILCKYFNIDDFSSLAFICTECLFCFYSIAM